MHACLSGSRQSRYVTITLALGDDVDAFVFPIFDSVKSTSLEREDKQSINNQRVQDHYSIYIYHDDDGGDSNSNNIHRPGTYQYGDGIKVEETGDGYSTTEIEVERKHIHDRRETTTLGQL